MTQDRLSRRFKWLSYFDAVTKVWRSFDSRLTYLAEASGFLPGWLKEKVLFCFELLFHSIYSI